MFQEYSSIHKKNTKPRQAPSSGTLLMPIMEEKDYNLRHI